jgi:PadR family transcriptional regulator PadR
MARGDYLGEFEEIVLLTTVRLGAEAYGMTIRREIEARTGRAVSIGAVYATLERLVDKRLLSVGERERDPARDGRPRRFFAVTTAGRSALDAAESLRARLRSGLRLRRSGRA